MLTLNNPLALVSAKILGVGVDLTVVREDEKYKLCLQVEAVTWSWCKVWGG